VRANRGLIDFQKYISFCCVAVTMVLTLGVIIEEAPTGAKIHSLYKSDNTYCKDQWIREHQNDCEKFKKADPWYYTLLFTTDIVLVLCLIAILLLFTDWILFIAPVILFCYSLIHLGLFKCTI
jgi:hypothetical protein